MTSHPGLFRFPEACRSIAGLALSMLLPAGLLCGCSTHRLPVTSLLSGPSVAIAHPEHVAELLQDIAAALPSYKEDGLARFEGPEIATVERDLKEFGPEGGDAVFPEDVTRIEGDWSRLVG